MIRSTVNVNAYRPGFSDVVRAEKVSIVRQRKKIPGGGNPPPILHKAIREVAARLGLFRRMSS